MADTEEKKFTTTVRIEENMYLELRQKLVARRMSFTDWLDKQVRKELGMSPRCSYPDTTPKK